MYLATANSADIPKDVFYFNNLAECSASIDDVLAYRLWEISESILIDRVGSFDDYLSIGDQFSSYTKIEKSNSPSLPPTPRSMSDQGTTISSSKSIHPQPIIQLN